MIQEQFLTSTAVKLDPMESSLTNKDVPKDGSHREDQMEMKSSNSTSSQ